jgi:hypothetical protein
LINHGFFNPAVAGVTRFKFAVLTVGGLHKLRYRRWQYATLTELKGQFREERFFQIKIIRFKFRCFIMSGIAETVSKAELGATYFKLLIGYV